MSNLSPNFQKFILNSLREIKVLQKTVLFFAKFGTYFSTLHAYPNFALLDIRNFYDGTESGKSFLSNKLRGFMIL